MNHPTCHNEAIELAHELYDKVRRLASALAPEHIEDFQAVQAGIEALELFISNTKGS